MKIEIDIVEGIRRLTMQAETQAEHYQIIAISDTGGVLRRYGNQYFALNFYLKDEPEHER